jgi:hypothetical protein
VTEAAEKVAQELRGELDRVRADAEAEVAASREWAAGEAAAVREAADAEVARAYAAADDAIRSAKAVVSRAKSIQPLSVPVPSFDFRPQIGHIEKHSTRSRGSITCWKSIWPTNHEAPQAERARPAMRPGRQRSPDAEVVNIVTAMLADPWVQRAIS